MNITVVPIECFIGCVKAKRRGGVVVKCRISNITALSRTQYRYKQGATGSSCWFIEFNALGRACIDLT